MIRKVIKGPLLHQKKPCTECPWRKDVPTGVFPVERYQNLASTAYDMGVPLFTCHKSAEEGPVVCAGFLLRGSDHNFTVRRALANGRLKASDVSDGGSPLYDSYCEMAVANGVDRCDVSIIPCR